MKPFKKWKSRIPTGPDLGWQQDAHRQPRSLKRGIDTILDEPRAREVITILSEYGRPYLVGGSVRDIYLGRSVHDLDIEVHGIEADQLGRIVSSRLGISGKQIGKQFGVYKVGRNIDVALPRTETKTGEKHTDFDVRTELNIGLKESAKRRDFTMNALMYDLISGETKDFFGGLNDIENKIIRHVDKKTFTEDALRVYRAAQFASRFGFNISDKTKELGRSMDLSLLPRERVYEEWKKLLLSDTPSIGLQALDDMGVIARYYPGVQSLKDVQHNDDFHTGEDLFTHTKVVIDKTVESSMCLNDDTDRLTVMLAAVAHDLGKSIAEEIHKQEAAVQGGDGRGLEPVSQFLSTLTKDTEIIGDVMFLVEHWFTPFQLSKSKANDSAFRRLINKEGIRRLGLLAALAEAHAASGFHKRPHGSTEKSNSREVDWFRQTLDDVVSNHDITSEGTLEQLIRGADLIGLGLKPGPRFGEILRDLQAQQEHGGLETREDALKFVRKKYGAGSSNVPGKRLKKRSKLDSTERVSQTEF